MESSHAVLRESSHAELMGSSHAVLRESSHAELRESSHAVLWGSSHAELMGSSHAVLWEFSCAHILRDTATVKILSPKAKTINIVYPKSVKAWCALKGIKIKNGRIVLWKAVDENGMDFYSGTINYDCAGEIIDPKWDAKYTGECGFGLHLADSPSAAKIFVNNKLFRLFSVSAAIKDCRCFPGNPDFPMKLRARACRKVKEYPCDYNEFFDGK
jgi:hypothetical protein